MPKSELKKAKDKAWSAFSIYIRTRDCIRFRDSLTDGICVTCNRDYPFKQLQAGHFIAGRNNAVLFDDEAVYAQCYGCNVGRGGAHIEYFVFMEKEWGREKIDELRAKSKETVKYKVWDYERIEQDFAERTDTLIHRFRLSH